MSDPGKFIAAPLCVGHCLHRALVVYGDRPLMGTRSVDSKEGKGLRSDFEWTTYRQVLARASGLARGLASVGVERRSHVGICSENCPEWVISDFACALNDFVSVGLHTSWPSAEIAAVAASAEIRCACVGLSVAGAFVDAAVAQRGRLAAGAAPTLDVLVVISGLQGEGAGDRLAALRARAPAGLRILELADVLALGRARDAPATLTGAGMALDSVVLEGPSLETDIRDTFTLIFSSGTSGAPKGMAVHKERWKLDAQSSGVAVTPNQRAISYMALAHGADRGIVWQTTFCGGSFGFASHKSHEALKADMKCIKPEFFLGMSHTWNRLYYDFRGELSRATRDGVLGMLRALGDREQAIESTTARKLKEIEASARWPSLVDAYCKTRAGRYQYEQVRAAFRDSLGGNLQTSVTGGAHTSDTVIDFIRNVCQVPGNECRVFNSYGATEFPGISKNGAISGLVELKLRDLPEMGYTNKDRHLYPQLVAAFADIYSAARAADKGGTARTGVSVAVLSAAVRSGLPPRVQSLVQTLPRRSHLRARFQEVLDRVSRGSFRGLTKLFSDRQRRATQRMRFLRTQLALAGKRNAGGGSSTDDKNVEGKRASAIPVLSAVEAKNFMLEAENLERQVRGERISLDEFVRECKRHFGEPRPRGEILVRAKDGSHAQEYWKLPEKSERTWVGEGGWYCTGDVGMIEFNPKHDKQRDPTSLFSLSECKNKSRVLYIVDRCKHMVELYIRGRSVWVAMEKLEQSVYQKLSCVRQICLVADRNQPVMVAIVVPSRSFLDQWAAASSASSGGSGTRTDAQLCSDAALQAKLLSLLQGAGAARGVKDYEIPQHVILEPEPWTITNGCLSAVGKPKRGYLQTVRYIDALDRLYANDEVKADALALQSMGSGSAAAQKAGSAEAGAGGGEAKARDEAVKIERAIDAAIAACEARAQQESKEPTQWPKDFPYAAKHKYMDWKFSIEDPNGNTLLNRELDALKAIGRSIQRGWAVWSEAKVKAKSERSKAWNDGLRQSESDFVKMVTALCASIHERQTSGHPGSAGRGGTGDDGGVEIKIERDPATGMPVKGVVEKLMDRALRVTARDCGAIRAACDLQGRVREIVAAVRRGLFRSVIAFASLGAAGGYSEEEEVLRYRWNQQRIRLDAAAELYNTRCPGHLTFQFDWCWPAEDIKANKAPLPSIPVGNAKVWCLASGRLIEQDVSQIGVPRYHVLDGPTTTDISCRYQHMFDALARALDAEARLESRQPERAADARAARALISEVHPWLDAAMSREVAHWTHLRHRTKKEFSRDDTPIGIISKACEAYSDRLALGMPLRFESPVPTAAGLACPVHDGYRWLRYGQVWTLVERLAKNLSRLGLREQMIALSGYNTFSFAVGDLAVARVSGCSVGLHTTYSQDEIETVMNNCDPVCLIATRNRVRDRGDGRWSLEKMRPNPALRHVIVMGLTTEQIDVERQRLASRGCEALDRKVQLHSFLEFVSPRADALDADKLLADPYACRGVRVPHPVDSKRSVNLFTLMYTSGSSGAPKGVMVATETFQQDMGESTSASPLVTVSYIPLSHSSDRVKLWEFLANGGRVGFAYYSASNWHDHEHSKKEGLIDSSLGGENNVRTLFAQVSQLCPSAMSCPPRIWNGLHFIYQRRIGDLCAGGETPLARAKQRALDEIRAMFGPRVSFLATGGAPTRPDVMAFARTLFPKARFVDSYGTTESGGITSNGKPLWSKNVRIRLRERPEFGLVGGDEGEIVVKSPQLHVGYYKNAKKTEQAWLGDGWYATGDLGRFDDRGRLHVLERISAVRKLRDGTKVYPGKLTSLLEQAPMASQVFVDAQPTRDTMAAVVVVDPAECAQFCREAKVAVADALVGKDLRQELLRQFSQLEGARALAVERIGVLILTEARWTVENKLLTGSQKKRPNRIRAVFAKQLDAAYTSWLARAVSA